MVELHDPGNKLRINEIFAFVSVDNNGNEGVCGFSTPEGMMPLIAADPERVESLRVIAKQLAGMTDKKIQLIKFTVREDMEVIER